MKRSEMLESMRELLYDNNVEGDDYTEKVLSIVEKLGMAPPHSETVFQEDAKIHIYPTGIKWDKE